MRVTYSNITSLKQPTYVLQMEDSYTYAIALNQGRINAGLTPIMPAEMVQGSRIILTETYPYEYNPADPPYNQWRGRWMANANYNWSDMFYSNPMSKNIILTWKAELKILNTTLLSDSRTSQVCIHGAMTSTRDLMSWGTLKQKLPIGQLLISVQNSPKL